MIICFEKQATARSLHHTGILTNQHGVVTYEHAAEEASFKRPAQIQFEHVGREVRSDLVSLPQADGHVVNRLFH